MATFVTTRGALHELENIIDSAKSQLVLISPYVRLAPDLIGRLRLADRRGVPITVVYGKEEMHDSQRAMLAEFTNLTLYFSKRLHAKCYYNEQRMIVTSLNLLAGSEHNWEMGFVFGRENEAYSAAIEEVDRIVNDAELRSAPRAKPAGKTTRGTVTAPSHQSGFCIRCSKQIPLDPDKPYCATCFASWSRWENWDFEEKACHRCGRAHATSRMKPQCYSCFKATTARG